LNFKILYSIIAVAFVGGLFSIVAAQSVPTITLDGNMHTTGNADIAGGLNIDGVITGPSFEALNARISTLEAAPPAGGPSNCDTDGSASITAQEMYDYIISQGISPNDITLSDVQIIIASTETGVATPDNGMIDDPFEVSHFNLIRILPMGIPPCPYL